MAEDRFAALRKLAESRATAAEPPKGSGVWGGVDLDAVIASQNANAPTGIRGFVADNLDNPVTRGAMTALNWLGTGKSYIASGLKETGDLLNQIAPDAFIGERSGNEGWDAPSWEDFKRQGSEGYGFGDVIEASQPDAPYWAKVAGGIAGDIIIDPLTYIAPFGKAALVGKGAVAEAYRSGARNVLAEALGTAAEQAGLQGDAAVQQLVKQAGLRGRGALTQSALARSGMTAEKLQQLGIENVGRKFLGKTFSGKGARGLTNVIEGTKGFAKQALGDNAGARFYRMARFGDRANKRALTDLLRNADTPAEKAMMASVISAKSKGAVRRASRWGDDWLHKTAARFKDSGVYGISDDAAVDLTHRVEAGLLDQADAVTGRSIFDETGVEMRDTFGVPLEMNIPNYVPHIITDNARRLSAGNQQLQEFISRIDDVAFFLKKRLDTRSIKEINDESMRLFNVKVLEDDFRDLVAIYLGSAQKQVERQIVQQGLVDAGIAVEKPFVRKLSAEQEAARQTVVKQVKQARNDVTVALSSGRKVRASSLSQVRKEVAGQRKNVMKKLDVLRKQMAASEAKYSGAARRLAGAEALVRDLEKTVADLRVVARGSRGSAKANLLGRIKRAEAALVAARKDLVLQSKKISKTVPEPLERLAKLKPLLDQIDAAEAKVAALGDDLVKLDEAILPLGARSAAGETAFRLANTPYEMLQREVASSGEILADVGPLLADQQQIRGLLDDAVTKLTAVLDSTKGPYKGVDAAVLQEHIDESMRIIDSLSDPALRQEFGPVVDILRAQNEQALLYDVTAATRGKDVLSMEEVLSTMSKPEFGEVIEYSLEKGWREMADKYQVPTWVDDILATQIKLANPEVWGDFVTRFRKIQNVWKGMATSRPGFVTRNMVSSTFNMYLEAGGESLQFLDDFAKFVRIRAKNPENYLEVAASKGLKDLDLLDDAFSAVTGSGSGQVANEFLTTLGRSKTWNPFTADFGGYRAIRTANEAWETTVRGAHALAVLKRGGTVDQAVDVLSKWHFNYRDLSSFDRKMKTFAAPFWSFWSNNMALQAYIWTHELPKLSRTVMNVKRNMERGQESDRDVPYYIADQMLFGTSIDPSGVSQYRDIGLPSMQYVGDIAGLYRNPAGTVANMIGPSVKMPLEALFRESMTTGKEYSGIRDYFGQNWQGFVPLYANAERIAQIADPEATDKGRAALLSFLTGIGTRTVTPRSRSYERLRQSEENG